MLGRAVKRLTGPQRSAAKQTIWQRQHLGQLCLQCWTHPLLQSVQPTLAPAWLRCSGSATLPALEGAPPQGAGVGAQAQRVKAVRRRQVLQVWRDGRARQPGLLSGRRAARLRCDRAHGARHLATQQILQPKPLQQRLQTGEPGTQEGCPGAVARRTRKRSDTRKDCEVHPKC